MESPTAGSRIAPHLTLQSVLGSGGTATVFEAFHARLQAMVAVKVCMVGGAEGPEADARLVREARLCARLREPCFPRVYDISRLEDGRPYYVMEKVVGSTLDVYAAALAPELDTSLELVRQLLHALRVAHDHGIVHRDVKPENVLLEEALDGSLQVRLMDFGIALLEDEEDIVSSTLNAPEVLGTPGYMAREQVCGTRVDARSDLHAVGVILYELVARRLPFDEHDPVALMEHTRAEPVPDIRFHVPDCPADVAEWIAQATAHDPRDRFQSARAALASLERLRGQPQRAAEADEPRPSEALGTQRPAPRAAQRAANPPTRPPGLDSGWRSREVVLATALTAAVAALFWTLPHALERDGSTSTEAEEAALARVPTHGPVLRPIVEPVTYIEAPRAPDGDGDRDEGGRDEGPAAADAPTQPAAEAAEASPRPALAAHVHERRGAARSAATARGARPGRRARATPVPSPGAATHARPASQQRTGAHGPHRPLRPQRGIPDNPYGDIPDNPY